MKSEITTEQASELIKSISLWHQETVIDSWLYRELWYHGYWYPSDRPAAMLCLTLHHNPHHVSTVTLYDHEATLLWEGLQAEVPDISDSIY